MYFSFVISYMKDEPGHVIQFLSSFVHVNSILMLVTFGPESWPRIRTLVPAFILSRVFF